VQQLSEQQGTNLCGDSSRDSVLDENTDAFELGEEVVQDPERDALSRQICFHAIDK